MLRLVHPSPEGKVSARRKGQKSHGLYPTAEEVERLRAAIRNLRIAYGGYDVLASVMGVQYDTLKNFVCRTSRGSYGIAVQAARAAGIPIEQILRPGVSEAGKCAFCGRKGAR